MPLGRVELEGRAWSGLAPVAGVDVSTDGETWQEAELERDVDGRWAWCRWSFIWEPPGPGEYVLSCSAHDEAGNVQPNDPPWNLGGYANNGVQRVTVTVV